MMEHRKIYSRVEELLSHTPEGTLQRMMHPHPHVRPCLFVHVGLCSTDEVYGVMLNG